MFMLKCECPAKQEENFDNLDVEEHTLPKSDQKVIFRLSYLGQGFRTVASAALSIHNVRMITGVVPKITRTHYKSERYYGSKT